MKNYPELKVKLLSDKAKVPTRGTAGSSGIDVYTPIDFVIHPMSDIVVPIEVAIDIPYGWDLTVCNKSGVATKKHLCKGAEIIDSDYTGNILIHLFNHSSYPQEFKAGQKIAQLVMREVWMGDVVLVDEIEKSTERGSGCCGSTGDS